MDPALITFFEMIPTGDGTYIAKPARPSQWIRPSRAAKILGLSSKTIIRRLEAGHLKGRKLGPSWLVDASDLAPNSKLCGPNGPSGTNETNPTR